jgi:hypothetical protein
VTTFTKGSALHDKITVDGVDMSNAFHSFGFTSDDNDVDVSGFSESGTDETQSGTRAEGFAGDMYITPETEEIMWPIHYNRSIVEVSWQPNGLIDPTRKVYHALCQLRTFDPSNTRGEASITPVSFKVADPNGITTS